MSDADKHLVTVGSPPDPISLIPGVPQLSKQTVITNLTRTISLYLDSQHQWEDLPSRCLETVLQHVCNVAQSVATAISKEYAKGKRMWSDADLASQPCFKFLSQASKSLQLATDSTLVESSGKHNICFIAHLLCHHYLPSCAIPSITANHFCNFVLP